jgi:membrane-bound lytic murein transglycosylase D
VGYRVAVKLCVTLAFLLAPGCLVAAQPNETDWSDVLDAAQRWAQDNLDEDVLKALQNADQSKVREFLRRFQDYLKSDDVLDVGQLKDAADAVLPLLDAHNETKPYAAWLRARLDYLDAAGELKSAAPRPKHEPGKPAPPIVNPSYAAQQKLWASRMSRRPWPKAAVTLVPKLKPVFRREGVPEALVWLAEVESGFDPRARSPAGAVGMFQLMPATAKQYGLSLWPRDQRMQAEPSAQAAAKILRRLYGRYDDWRLALAAYNAGAGTVSRLLQRYHAKSFERIAPHLPAETQMYVPKVEATLLRREDCELVALKAPATD